jgi:hypothetical protein
MDKRTYISPPLVFLYFIILTIFIVVLHTKIDFFYNLMYKPGGINIFLIITFLFFVFSFYYLNKKQLEVYQNEAAQLAKYKGILTAKLIVCVSLLSLSIVTPGAKNDILFDSMLFNLVLSVSYYLLGLNFKIVFEYYIKDESVRIFKDEPKDEL